jgi:hypothetical protein
VRALGSVSSKREFTQVTRGAVLFTINHRGFYTPVCHCNSVQLVVLGLRSSWRGLKILQYYSKKGIDRKLDVSLRMDVTGKGFVSSFHSKLL